MSLFRRVALGTVAPTLNDALVARRGVAPCPR